jgi:hypothetical protein
MIVLLASCGKDFVELTNPNAITTGSFWQTQEDILLGTNALYQALIYDGTYMRKYPWTMDVRADDSYNVTPTGYVMSNLTTYTIGGEEINQPWECNYIGIWRANQVLDFIDGVEMNEELRQRCIGEAKFIRALCYFNLLNIYQNVVVYETSAQSTDDFYIPQSPPEEVWDLVYRDFEDAVEKCWNKNETRGGVTNEIGRATKAAAATMLARSYLMNGRYEDALPWLRNVISSADGGNEAYGFYDLVPDYRDNFTETNENNIESIFEIQYDMDLGGAVQGWVGNPGPDWAKMDGYNKSLAPQPFGWGDIAPSVWIWDEFHEETAVDGGNDGRMEACFYWEHPGDTNYTVYGYYQDTVYTDDFLVNETVFDAMGWATVGNVDLNLPDDFNVYIRKYLTEDPLLDRAWRSGINRRLIRYADVLLLYAECLNETGQTAAAYPFINKVRNRANLADLTPGLSQEDMFWQLDHERALEFCFEAWRYLDLLRWGYFESQATVNEILLPRDPEFQNWLPGREYLAIPVLEIERTNGIVTQNPAWN